MSPICCCFPFFLCIFEHQTLMVQVAKRGASVLKRKKSKNKMDQAALNSANFSVNSTNLGTISNNPNEIAQTIQATRSESDDVIFYTEEQRTGRYDL